MPSSKTNVYGLKLLLPDQVVVQTKSSVANDGQFHEFPTERTILRFTNAFDEKRRRYCNASIKGIISEDDNMCWP